MATPVSAATNGMIVRCLVCGYDEFSEKRPPVRAALHALFPNPHHHPGPVMLVCQHCGHVHRFDSVRTGALTLRVEG